MDTQSVWDSLSSIPVGTVVAWVTVICAIIAAISTGAVKLYKVFERYRGYKEEDEAQKELLKKHDEILDDISQSLMAIKDSMEIQKDVNKKRLRYDITKLCNRALSERHVTVSILKSIEEMFEDYVGVYNGNSWVKTLVFKVRKLPVIEDLDEE